MVNARLFPEVMYPVALQRLSSQSVQDLRKLHSFIIFHLKSPPDWNQIFWLFSFLRCSMNKMEMSNIWWQHFINCNGMLSIVPIEKGEMFVINVVEEDQQDRNNGDFPAGTFYKRNPHHWLGGDQIHSFKGHLEGARTWLRTLSIHTKCLSSPLS